MQQIFLDYGGKIMTRTKKAVTAVITALAICGAGVGGYFAWKKLSADSENSSTKVYVQKVSDLNTASGFDLTATKYSAVVEAQASADVKLDSSKTVDQILVKEGDIVKKGDKVLTYDVESIELQLDQAKLEAERLQAQIDSNNAEIKQLETEKKTASDDAVVTLNTQILSLKSENATNEYDKKAKDAEAAKLEKSMDNAFVLAPSDGTVTELKTVEQLSEQGGDVIMKITAEGAYRVKGKVNEQNIRMLYEGCPVIMRSRIDDSVQRGEVSKIDTKPSNEQNSDMGYGYGESDEYSSSSNYAFYITPDDPEALMLGQHLLVEVDNGQEESIDKEGIWLYSEFIVTKDGKSFVWAADSDNRIEKREVTLGKKDEMNGDVEIKSGLKESDKIAFPAKYIKEGMTATVNEEEVSVDENDLGYEDDPEFTGEDYGETEDFDADYNDPLADLTEEEIMSMTDEELEAYINEHLSDDETVNVEYDPALEITDEQAEEPKG